ncbi:long-chain fatty acid-CoA ligase [Entomortierella beljakovae]|nr:long-chain fatty acid-CoA ligase [Entomortierella beljakovae]
MNKGKYCVEYDEVEHIYRNVNALDGLLQKPRTKAYKDLTTGTLAHLYEFMANKYEDKDAMGWRDIIKIHKKEKKSSNPDERPKTWITYELSDYKWMSYRQAKTSIDSIGSALKGLGINKGDYFMIFSSTSPEWYLSSHACFSQSITIVTAYDSMDENSIEFIISQSESKGVFADATTLPVIANLMQKNSFGVKAIIYAGQEFEVLEYIKILEGIPNRAFEIIHIDDLKNTNADGDNKVQTVYPDVDDLACIMYTSGSTGYPKGVQLTHGNLMATIGGIDDMAEDLFNHDDIIISYLPLAHVLEFVLSHFMSSMGVRLGFGRARTLMDDAVAPSEGQEKGVGDFKALRPTLMAGVPVIWERIRKGIIAKVNKMSFPIRTLFFASINTKWAILQATGSENVITRMIDSIVFSQVKDLTGGHLRMALTGGAGISDETHRFLQAVLCFVVSGYGLTEVCGCASITLPSMGYRLRTVGQNVSSLELKLANVPDTEYTGDNGSGELWYRGPSVMKGYFKLEEETNKVMTSDGWFKTGDIAVMNPDGTMSIKDRVKNLVKLAHGEYVAIEKCEAIYRDSKHIKSICIIAESGYPVLLAVVEPADENATAKEILAALKEQAKAIGLSKPETIQGVIVDSSDWTKNGFMTASNKIKRREVKKAHEKELEELIKKF